MSDQKYHWSDWTTLADTRRCEDCRWFQPSPLPFDVNRCELAGHPARYARSTGMPCGPEGNLWERRGRATLKGLTFYHDAAGCEGTAGQALMWRSEGTRWVTRQC